MIFFDVENVVLISFDICSKLLVPSQYAIKSKIFFDARIFFFLELALFDGYRFLF